jgi:hypothetical protein
MAISEVALEPVVPFFHFITKPKIFIAGPAKAGLDDAQCAARGLSTESPSPASHPT